MEMENEQWEYEGVSKKFMYWRRMFMVGIKQKNKQDINKEQAKLQTYKYYLLSELACLPFIYYFFIDLPCIQVYLNQPFTVLLLTILLFYSSQLIFFVYYNHIISIIFQSILKSIILFLQYISYIYYHYLIFISKMIIKLLLLSILIVSAFSAVQADRVYPIPGYPQDYPTAIYSGYLSTTSSNRSLHYIFVQSVKGSNNNDPVTLWLNGGPGCSSLLGFLQQIGPYYLADGVDYQFGDNLTLNNYSWHKVSNLLFLESPAGVGYSYNLDDKFQYNDAITASDNLQAVIDFFNKYPEYNKNGFWIAGESYAGKYIPDLAVLIDKYNFQSKSPINMKGIAVGNGVMSFLDGQLQRSTVDYMINHEFIDPQLIIYWKTSCALDPESAGCGYFFQRFADNTIQLNPYSKFKVILDVYDYCYYNDSFVDQKPKKYFKTQQSILRSFLNFHKVPQGNPLKNKFNGAPCAYFDGVYNYFKLASKDYHAKFPNMQWNGPCAQNITYHIDLAGSIGSYRYLLSRIPKYQIALYSGDWDSVVPYVDTLKNIQKLNLLVNSPYNPWYTNNQHSGFSQLFSGVIYSTFKGASHQVPQSKRPEALQYFTGLLNGHQMSQLLQKAKKSENNLFTD